MSPRARFETAQRFQSEEGVPIAEAFAFMSALYFRGKIAYARHFGAPERTFVIAPGFGLVPPDWALTADRMQKLRRTGVDVNNRTYASTLRRAATEVAATLDAECNVVLLGSVATGKYVDILRPVFASRLRFPAVFAGLGDMSRGGLMLRAVRENRELEYVTLDAPRSRAKEKRREQPLSS